MTVGACMKSPVLTVKPDESVRHVRERMEQYRVNQFPVMVDGQLVGIVTDRDVRDASPSVFEVASRRRARPDGTDPDRIPISDVMSRNVLTLAPDAPVAEAVRVMRRERIGALPVVDHGKLVGILTRSDLLDALAVLARG